MRFPLVVAVNNCPKADCASLQIHRRAKRPLRTEYMAWRPLRARNEMNGTHVHSDYWTFK